MSVLGSTSPNDLLEKSIDRADVDSKWKRELKNYIKKKNAVDHRSLSRTREGEKFWPQVKRGRKNDTNHLSSRQFKSVIGRGRIMDDHSTSRWDTKKHVSNMRLYIQRSFQDSAKPPETHKSFTRGDCKFNQKTKEGYLSNQIEKGFIQRANMADKARDKNFHGKTQIY